MPTIWYAELKTPIGTLELESDGHALTRIFLPEEGRPATSPMRRVRKPGLFREAGAQLGAYFRGERRAFDLPLEPRGTPFQRTVWGLLREIPWGTTITYAKLARRAGNPKASRA